MTVFLSKSKFFSFYICDAFKTDASLSWAKVCLEICIFLDLFYNLQEYHAFTKTRIWLPLNNVKQSWLLSHRVCNQLCCLAVFGEKKTSTHIGNVFMWFSVLGTCFSLAQLFSSFSLHIYIISISVSEDLRLSGFKNVVVQKGYFFPHLFKKHMAHLKLVCAFSVLLCHIAKYIWLSAMHFASHFCLGVKDWSRDPWNQSKKQHNTDTSSSLNTAKSFIV